MVTRKHGLYDYLDDEIMAYIQIKEDWCKEHEINMSFERNGQVVTFTFDNIEDMDNVDLHSPSIFEVVRSLRPDVRFEDVMPNRMAQFLQRYG